MLKCNLNKVAKHFIEIALWHEGSPLKLSNSSSVNFQNTFS